MYLYWTFQSDITIENTHLLIIFPFLSWDCVYKQDRSSGNTISCRFSIIYENGILYVKVFPFYHEIRLRSFQNKFV